MREHRPRPDQPEAVVHVEIVGGVGKAPGDGGDLAVVLGEVGVHQHVGMRGDQRARLGELRVGRGQHEARRHRIAEPAAPPPARDQRLGLGTAALGRVAQGRRAGVHQHLARNDPHVPRACRLEQRVDRLRMDGREHQRAGGAVAQQLVAEEAGDRIGVGAVREACLLREDVAVEPFQQLLAMGGDAVGLRVVDMGVDEAGNDRLARPVCDVGFGEP